jgi:hypothetical protein
LWKFVSGFYPPVFVEHLGDTVHDAGGAGFVGEEVVHGPGAPSHLPESTGAHTVQKKLADAGIHLLTPAFIAVQNRELHAPLVKAGHPDILDRDELDEQIPEVMPVSIPLAFTVSFICPESDLI